MHKGGKHLKSSKIKNHRKKEKIYVIDTNVIINDPNIVKKLNGRVFVPTTVLSELDKHKHGHTEKARSVREFARYIERNQDRVWFHNSEKYEGTADEKIISAAQHLSDLYDVTVVTNDILMGVLARAKNLNIERYEITEASADEHYKGVLIGQSAEVARDLYQEIKPRNKNQYLVCHDGIYRTSKDGLIKQIGRAHV